MQEPPAYCDLNVPFTANCEQVCKAALAKGFKTLALNTVVTARECLPKVLKVGKKRKFEQRDAETLPINPVNVGSATGTDFTIPVPVEPVWQKRLLVEYPKCKILRRISIVFGDASAELQKIVAHPVTQMYDIIAVIPLHLDAIQGCLTARHINFDIISFDFEGPYWMKKIKVTRQRGSMAANREIYFELTYSSALHGDMACENLILTANVLLEDACTKRFKNIIISSGCLKSDEVRAPKDVTAIGYLLGFDDTACVQMMKEHSSRVVTNAMNRKHGKTWVVFTPTSSEPLPQQ